MVYAIAYREPSAVYSVPLLVAGLLGLAALFLAAPKGMREVYQVQARTVDHEVKLHVYHLFGNPVFRGLNNTFRVLSTGMYHTGVEVNGVEYSYGCTNDASTGVYYCNPGGCASHFHREVVSLGNTRLSEAEVTATIRRLCRVWLGREYNMLRHNCSHFSDHLCRELGVPGVPGWTLSLPNSTAGMLDRGKKIVGIKPSTIFTSEEKPTLLHHKPPTCAKGGQGGGRCPQRRGSAGGA
jgi:hypothetical protein